MARKLKEKAEVQEDFNDGTVEHDQNENGQDESDEGGAPGYQRIKIQSNFYDVLAPYAGGHVLTEQEARALNRLRAENVRNNVASVMKRLAEGENGRAMTEEEIADYDRNYTFNQRTRVQSAVNPVDREERKLADAIVRKALSSQGLKFKEVDKDQFEAWVNQAVTTGKFRAQAEAIVAARNASFDEDFSLSA